MSLLENSDVASRIAKDVVRAGGSAKGVIDEKVARTGARLRSQAQTRKSAATRDKIMAAAMQLMVEHAGVDFQMSEVSARCKLSKGSLYYYFSDKGSLVSAVFDRAVDDLVERVEGAVAKAPSAQESIIALVQELALSFGPKSPLSLAMTHRAAPAGVEPLAHVETSLARVIAILTAQFERAKGEGLVRPEIDAHMGAATIAGAFVVFEYTVQDPSTLEGADTVQSLLDLVFSGIGTPRARELFSLDAAGKKGA